MSYPVKDHFIKCGHPRTPENTIGPSPKGGARCRECRNAYQRRYNDDAGIERRQVEAIAVRFWRMVNKDGPTPEYNPSLGPCWLWMGYVNPNGYVQVAASRSNRTYLAHRLSYVLSVGEVPDGLVLDHLCRVRHCVNPSHLEPVTSGENTRRGTAPQITRERWEAYRNAKQAS